jgi:hypothetical protein
MLGVVHPFTGTLAVCSAPLDNITLTCKFTAINNILILSDIAFQRKAARPYCIFKMLHQQGQEFFYLAKY